MRLRLALWSTVSLLVVLFAATGSRTTSPAGAQADTATLTIHERGCPYRPADGDWYTACHDLPQQNVAGSTIRVYQVRGKEFTTTADAQGNGTLIVPPGTYEIAWRPGDVVPVQVVFCSPSDDPATSLGDPVTLAAGDDVTCDYYISGGAEAPTQPVATQPAAETPSVATATSIPAPTATQGTTVATEGTTAGDPTVIPTTPPDTTAGATTTLTPETDGSRTMIYAGGCDRLDPGAEPVGVLTDVRPPAGEVRGADGAAVVETSFTTLDLPLDELLAEDHVLVVFDEDDDSVPLACGAIGGTVTPGGALTFGLPAVEASRFSGVAYLAEDGNQTHVSVFLAENLNGDATATAE